MTKLTLAATAVFLLAVLVRLPACYESLWVDELHSAWAVWAGLGEVAERAEAGNQSPWYFYALWVWKQLAGGSEPALRLPSVLAAAAACVVLVVAAGQASRSVITGALAGLLLALERNAIFFGTEARPFALVMLLTAIAAASAVRLQRGDSNWARCVLAAAAFLAVLMHPTAGLPLTAIVAVAWGGATLTRCGRLPGASSSGQPQSGQGRAAARSGSPGRAAMAPGWRASDLLLSGAAMLLALAVNAASVGRVWRQRSNWASFAQPQSLSDLGTIWPWWWMIVVPLSLWGLLQVATRLRRDQARRNVEASRRSPASIVWRQQWPLLLAAVLVTTAIGWGLGRSGLLSIWHRRYMVGVLPLLCWASADLWRAAAAAAADLLRLGAHRRRVSALLAVVAVLAVTYEQGTAARLASGRVRLTQRGEDWRGAVQWVRDQRRPGEPLWVAAELIESADWEVNELDRGGNQRAGPDGEAHDRYLLYPVQGPYRLANPQPMGLSVRALRSAPFAHQMSNAASRADRRTSWIIARLPGGAMKRLLQSPGAAELPRATDVRSFGGVSVIRFEHRER